MRSRPGAWRYVVGPFAVAALAWLAYAPILGAYFRHDDFWWLSTARQWADGALPLTHAPAGVAPLYSLLYDFLYRTFGLNPQPYFASLLLCHVLDSCLVLALVWLLTRRYLAGLTGGLLFALLFCHHEAVAWPAGGPHVFALTGILLALICWVVYRRGHRWGLPLAVLCALAAIFTKDSGIAVIPLLLALDLAGFPRERRWPLAWLALPVVALAAWRVLIPPIAEPMRPGSPSFHLGLHSLWNLIHNPPQMLVPDLRFENYQQFLGRLLPPGAVGAALLTARAAILLLSALAVWAMARGSRLVKVGALWCYVGFLPFIPFSQHFARAPRYLYIPSIGLALLAGLAALAVSRRTKPGCSAARVVAVGLFGLYLVGSFGFARLVCANRLAESAQRRQIMSIVLQRLPQPEPGAEIVLAGLPVYLQDAAQGLPVLYGRPVAVRISRGPVKPGAYWFTFDEASPGRLIGFSGPSRPTPAASGHRTPPGPPGTPIPVRGPAAGHGSRPASPVPARR